MHTPCQQPTSRLLANSALCLVAASTIFFGTPEADATPIYAIRSVNACDTCHIEPSGWANPDVAKRLCTLDCTGCHVNPSGGGLRTPTGNYYGRQTLPTWGKRPGDAADPEAYRPEGHPRKGRYRFGEGFDGWWPGEIDMHTIEDRFGDIDPDPRFSFGTDIRFMNLFLLSPETEQKYFPMQTDFYLMGKPLDKITVLANAGLRGRKDDLEDPTFKDHLIARELFVKAGPYDNNTYIRAGRFNPSYGWRLPNHTAYTRRDLGFGENRQVLGLEGGINPNYLYANVAAFYQGLDGWPGDEEPPGVGSTFNIGWRDLGWHAGYSLQYLNRTDDNEPFDDVTTGVQWGFNFYPLVYLGEVDLRLSLAGEEGTDNITALFAYHELNWLVSKGLSLKTTYEWQDTSTRFKDDESHRAALGLDWHPYTFTHLEAQYRRTWASGVYPITELGSASADEALLILHAWF